MSSEGGSLSSNGSSANSKPSGELNNSWTRYSPGNRNFSLELPGEPRQMDIPVPDELRNLFRKFENYSYNDEQLFVLISHFESSVSFANANLLKGMADGFVRGITSRPGISDTKVSTTLNSPSDVSVVGSFIQNGILVKLNGRIIAKGNDTWMTLTGCPQADSIAQEPAQRVVNSAKFN